MSAGNLLRSGRIPRGARLLLTALFFTATLMASSILFEQSSVPASVPTLQRQTSQTSNPKSLVLCKPSRRRTNKGLTKLRSAWMGRNENTRKLRTQFYNSKQTWRGSGKGSHRLRQQRPSMLVLWTMKNGRVTRTEAFGLQVKCTCRQNHNRGSYQALVMRVCQGS